MSAEIEQELTWYQRAIDWDGQISSKPELSPYVDFEKYPLWLASVAKELRRQSLHLSPNKHLSSYTSQEAGKFLGQICANNYMIEEHQRGAAENNRRAEVEKVLLEKIKEEKGTLAAAGALHKKHVSELLAEEYEKFKTRTLTKVRDAFDEALSQSNYGEAVEFFVGFAKGLSKPGVKGGTLALATDATPIYLEMFYHWQKVDQLHTVTELYDWLLKRGFTVETLGDIDRLRTLCKRIKYAPGKRGRPRKSRK